MERGSRWRRAAAFLQKNVVVILLLALWSALAFGAGAALGDWERIPGTKAFMFHQLSDGAEARLREDFHNWAESIGDYLELTEQGVPIETQSEALTSLREYSKCLLESFPGNNYKAFPTLLWGDSPTDDILYRSSDYSTYLACAAFLTYNIGSSLQYGQNSPDTTVIAIQLLKEIWEVGLSGCADSSPEDFLHNLENTAAGWQLRDKLVKVPRLSGILVVD